MGLYKILSNLSWSCLIDHPELLKWNDCMATFHGRYSTILCMNVNNTNMYIQPSECVLEM